MNRKIRADIGACVACKTNQEGRQMSANEKDKRIKLPLDMQKAINVCRLAAIVGMFDDTMSKLDDTWYPRELRPVLNEFRYESLESKIEKK